MYDIQEGLNQQYLNLNCVSVIRNYKWALMSFLNEELRRKGYTSSPANDRNLRASKVSNRFQPIEYRKNGQDIVITLVSDLKSIINSGNYIFYVKYNKKSAKVKVENAIGKTLKQFIQDLISSIENENIEAEKQDYSSLGFNPPPEGLVTQRIFKTIEIEKHDTYNKGFQIHFSIKNPREEIERNESLQELLYCFKDTSRKAESLYDRVFDSYSQGKKSLFYSPDQKQEMIKALRMILNKQVIEKYYTKQKYFPSEVSLQWDKDDTDAGYIHVDFFRVYYKMTDEEINEQYEEIREEAFKIANRYSSFVSKNFFNAANSLKRLCLQIPFVGDLNEVYDPKDLEIKIKNYEKE